MSVEDKVQKLRSLVRLLSDASEVVIKEWEMEAQNASQKTSSLPTLPSVELHDARRAVLGACGMCMDLVQEPQSRLMEMGTQYYISRALHIAAEARIADILADADPQTGVPVQKISEQVGIEEQKVGKSSICVLWLQA